MSLEGVNLSNIDKSDLHAWRGVLVRSVRAAVKLTLPVLLYVAPTKVVHRPLAAKMFSSFWCSRTTGSGGFFRNTGRTGHNQP